MKELMFLFLVSNANFGAPITGNEGCLSSFSFCELESEKIGFVMRALSSENSSTVQNMIDEGADLVHLNAISPILFPLLVVENKAHGLDILKLLIAEGIHPDSYKLGDKSILYYSIETDNHKLSGFLLESERYSSLLNDDRLLLAAASSGNIDVYKILADTGLDIAVVDKNGDGIMEYAEARGQKEFLKFLVE